MQDRLRVIQLNARARQIQKKDIPIAGLAFQLDAELMTMEEGFHNGYRNIGGKVTPETENVQHLARDRNGRPIRPNHNMARTLLQLPLLIIKPDGTIVSPPPKVGGAGPGGNSNGGAVGSTGGKTNAGKSGAGARGTPSVPAPRVRYGMVRMMGGAVGAGAVAMVAGYFWNKYVQGVHNESLELDMTRDIQPKIDAILDEYFTKRRIARLQVKGIKAYANVTMDVFQPYPNTFTEPPTPGWPEMTLENVVVSETKIDRVKHEPDGKGQHFVETKSWEVALPPPHDGEYERMFEELHWLKYVLDNVELSRENHGFLNTRMLLLEYNMVQWLTEPYGRGTRTDAAR
jgi:hypothetical protein